MYSKQMYVKGIQENKTKTKLYINQYDKTSCADCHTFWSVTSGKSLTDEAQLS